MKKRFLLIAILIMTALIAAVMFVACDPNKEKSSEATLTFYRNGIGEDSVLSAAVGEDISSKFPEPNSTQTYYFGGWYDNAELSGSPVTLPAEMPAESKSYYARWYRTYTVNFYVQNAEHDGYELAGSVVKEVNKGIDSVTIDVSQFTDYDIYTNLNQNSTLAIEDRDGSHVDLKYDRIEHEVRYHAGLAGEEATTLSHATNGHMFVPDGSLVHAEEHRANGKRLAGFSLSEGGEISSPFIATGPFDLYAVWDDALSERNGSADLLYLPKSEPDKAYLYREGLEEKAGVYDSSTNLFRFELDEENMLSGRVYPDGTFAMQREGIAPLYLYIPKSDTLAQGITLTPDYLDGAELVVDDDFDSEVESIIYIDAAMAEKYPSLAEFSGMYVPMTLEAGSYQCAYGRDLEFNDFFIEATVEGVSAKLHFATGTYESESGQTYDIFVLRGNEFGLYTDDLATIYLDGYGNARYIVDEGYMLGEYAVQPCDERIGDEDEAYVEFPTGDVSFLLHYEFDAPSEQGIPQADMYRFDLTDGTYAFDGLYDYKDPFTAQGNANELYLSGYGIAVLNGNVRYRYEMELDGMLLPYCVNLFSLYDEGGDEVRKRVFTNALDGTYFEVPTEAKVKFLTDFGGPVNMLYFEGGKVHYYQFDENTFALRYTYGDDSVVTEAGKDELGRQLYSVTFESFEEPTFKYFEVETDGIVTCYIEGTPVFNGKYTADDGSTLTLTGFGEATYTDSDGITHEGRYLNYGGVPYFMCSDDYCSLSFDFNVDGEKFSIIVYSEMPETLYHFVRVDTEAGPALAYNAIMTVAADGKATISVPIDDDKNLTIEGSVELYDVINYYYLFNVETVSEKYSNLFVQAISQDFRFCLVAYQVEGEGEDVRYGFQLSDGFEDSYDLDNGRTLILDGFGGASITSEKGDVVGYYDVLTETTEQNGKPHVHYIFDFTDVKSNELFFDLWDDGRMTQRGDEFTMTGYYIYDGSNYYNLLIMPDGNGLIDLIYYDEGLIYLATAKYTLDGDIGFATDLSYTKWVVMDGFSKEECDALNALAEYIQGEFELYDGDSFTFKLMRVSGEDCFMVLDEDVADVYAFEEDWSVLKLDGFNGATYIDSFGDSHRGTYTVSEYSSDGGANIMKLIRFYGSFDEKAFLVTTTANVIVGVEFGNYAAADDRIFLDGLGNVTLTIGENVTEGKYSIDLSTGVVQAEFADGSLVFKINRSLATYVVRDDSVAGVYKEVDKEGVETGVTLTLDGMGAGSVLEDGVLTRYSVAHVELDVYGLTNVYDSGNYIEVKLDRGALTFMRSDGVMIMEESAWFDFVGGGEVRVDTRLKIDSFGVVKLNGEAIGSLERVEQPYENAEYLLIYHVALTDGGKTSYARYQSGHFPANAGSYWGYAYAEYHEASDVTLTDSEGIGDPMILSGYGYAFSGAAGYVNSLYWFDGENMCVSGLYDDHNANYNIYSVDYDNDTYTSMGDTNKENFKVEGNVLTAYTGGAKKIVIPKDMGITEIGEGVFSYATLQYNITSVDLGGVVTVIGKNAFCGEGLSADTINTILGAENVKVIGETAFQFSDIAEIDLPNIQSIGVKAFYGSRFLKSIRLGSENSQWTDGIADQAFLGVGRNLNDGEAVTIEIRSEHAPKLGNNALGTTSQTRTRNVIFTCESAYNEAIDATGEIGSTYTQYDGSEYLHISYNGESASIASNSDDTLYYDERKNA